MRWAAVGTVALLALAAGCMEADEGQEGIEAALEGVPGVHDADAKAKWDHPDRIDIALAKAFDERDVAKLLETLVGPVSSERWDTAQVTLLHANGTDHPDAFDTARLYLDEPAALAELQRWVRAGDLVTSSVAQFYYDGRSSRYVVLGEDEHVLAQDRAKAAGAPELEGALFRMRVDNDDF